MSYDPQRTQSTNDGATPRQDNVFNSDQFLTDAKGNPALHDNMRQSRNLSTNNPRATAQFAETHEPQYSPNQHKDIIETRSANPGQQNILPEVGDGPEFSERIKKQILLACLFALLVGNMMLLNVAAFLPIFIEQKEWSNPDEPLNSTDSGLIIASFSVAQIVFAPFNSIIKNFFGSKNTIIFGFFLMTFTTFGLGLIALIDNSQAFKYVALVTRFFQGQGDIMLQITSYTIITTIFSDNVMKYISYIEITVGMGLGLGPAIGSIIDGQVGYAWTMYIFGILNAFAMIVCFFCLPSELNKTDSDEEIAEVEAEMEELMDAENLDLQKEKKKKLTWFTILKNRHFVFALITCFFGTSNLVYFQGYIAPYMSHFGFGDDDVGYVMAIQQVTYLPMCLILPHFCETSFPRKLQFVIAMFGFSISCFMLGPSYVLDFPLNYWIIIFAFPVIGIFQFFVFIPIIPEMLERVQVELNVVEGEDPELDAAINDKVNDAYGLIYALSMFVAPVVGGIMYDSIDGRLTSDYFAFLNIGLGVFLFVFNCGPFVFKEHREFNAKLADLKEKAEKLALAQNMNLDDNVSINDLKPHNPMFGGGYRGQSRSLIRPKVGALNMLDSNSYKQQQYAMKKKSLMLRRKMSYVGGGRGNYDQISYDGRSIAAKSANTAYGF